MTADERLGRIEHITAAIAEERRKDREEYKTLWRDTQRQINELASGMVELRQNVDSLAVETRLRFDQLGDRIDQLVSANGRIHRQEVAGISLTYVLQTSSAPNYQITD